MFSFHFHIKLERTVNEKCELTKLGKRNCGSNAWIKKNDCTQNRLVWQRVADMNLNIEYNCEKKENGHCKFGLWRWLMA